MWAVFVSKYREVFKRLPAQYQISKQPLTGGTISHHYVKDGSRNDFYKKGLKRLKKLRFLRDLAISFECRVQKGEHP